MDRNSKCSQAVVIAYNLGYRMTNEGEMIKPNGELIIGGFKNGYRVTSLIYEKTAYLLLFHRLQAYQKYGDAMFDAECVRHENDNMVDNSEDNILIGSMAENRKDMILNSFHKNKNVKLSVLNTHDNKEHGNTKYTQKTREYIFNEYTSGRSGCSIAKELNMGTNTTYKIIRKFKNQIL